MEYGLILVTSTDVQELIPIETGRGSIKSISLCNASASPATVRLFFSDGRDTAKDTSLIENMVIPSGVTLVLDENLSFDNNALGMSFQMSGTDPNMNIIIK